MRITRSTRQLRGSLLTCTALGIGIGAAPALAQTNSPAAPVSQSSQPGSRTIVPGTTAQDTPAVPATDTPVSGQTVDEQRSGGVAEIVVTAQRREQSLQDVPIAITAITSDAIQTNRVISVQDLTGLAPNFTVRPSAGGQGLPSFSMRGVVSYGVVPGSDKQISIYVDGVYIGSPRGSAFELADIERIEVLRGPQGTLFGRNATAGAVSIVTRDPKGVFGARQDVSIGNYGQLRTRTTIDTPAFGPFSAYGSFVHNERDGDIRNLGAGTVWDRTGPDTRVGRLTSPRRLGDRNGESWFGALRFEPSDSFNMTYKYDRASTDFTAEGTTLVALNPRAPLIGNLLQTLISSNPTPVVVTGKRPSAVDNSFVIPSVQRTQGHNLTANWQITDNLSFKNIAAYRKVYLNSATNLEGLGGLVFTPQALVPYATFAAFSRAPALATAPAAVQAAAIRQIAGALAPLIGSRFCVICNNSQNAGDQYSDEAQLVWNTDLVTLTTGGLYFKQKDRAGGPIGLANNFQFVPLPASGRLPLGNESTAYTRGESIAAYAQGEFHLTEQLDLVAGGRITRDRKSSRYVNGGIFTPGPNGFVDGMTSGQAVISDRYRDTRPNYSIGLNYQPNSDTLLYAKYSTAFVSGGSIGGLGFDVEKVRSTEGGFKLDLLDRRLRANLAVFHAKYDDVQSAQSGTNVGRPDLGTAIIDAGTLKATGFEAEVTAVPIEGLTLNGSLGYTHVRLLDVNPILDASVGGRYVASGIPAWTGRISAQYETQPLFDDARLLLSVDANYQSRRRDDPNPDRSAAIPEFAAIEFQPSYWLVNGRVAIRNVKIGPTSFELGGYVRNLTNRSARLFPLTFGNFLASSNYIPARTYGLDLVARF